MFKKIIFIIFVMFIISFFNNDVNAKGQRNFSISRQYQIYKNTGDNLALFKEIKMILNEGVPTTFISMSGPKLVYYYGGDFFEIRGYNIDLLIKIRYVIKDPISPNQYNIQSYFIELLNEDKSI